MSEPTWQTKAAKRIVKLFYLIKRSEKTRRTLQEALLRTSRDELEQDIEAIITQYQPPEGKVAGKLLEALKDIALGQCCGTPGCDIDNPLCDVMTARAARHLVVLAAYKQAKT